MLTLFTMFDLRDAYLEVARKGDWVSVPELVELLAPRVSEADIEAAVDAAAELAPGFQRLESGEIRYVV